MSRIPNSAIPHAVAEPEAEIEEEGGETRTLTRRAAAFVRDNPKTAIAAGAALAAGAAAAAAIPLARARRSGISDVDGKARKGKKS